MPALPSWLISSLSCVPAVTVPEIAVGLPAPLADLPDPRARRGVRHPLTVVVTAAMCAVVAGTSARLSVAVAEHGDTSNAGDTVGRPRHQGAACRLRKLDLRGGGGRHGPHPGALRGATAEGRRDRMIVQALLVQHQDEANRFAGRKG